MIPVATHSLTVRRPASLSGQDPYGEGYDDDWSDVRKRHATRVRAVISQSGAGVGQSSGQALATGGEMQAVRYRLVCDVTDLSYRDTLVDDATGDEYEVLWAVESPGIGGLGHMRGELRRIEGQS